MTHGRQQIRAAAAALIATNGVTVEETRQYPMLPELMPRYLVYATGESVDESMSTGSGIMRVLDLVVEAVITGDETTVDDDLDGHAVYLETALNWSRLGGLALKTILQSSQLSIRTDGDVSLGILTLTFAVTYRTVPSNPETIA